MFVNKTDPTVEIKSKTTSNAILILLSSIRATGMGDIEVAGYNAYPVSEMVGDITAGIFSEAKENKTQINILRRHLQRSYVQILI
jgi:hypothetical protein